MVRAKDLSTPVIRSIKREFSGLGRTIGQGMSSLARNVERGMIAIGAAAVAGIGYALKAAGDFQAQLNTINTVAQETPEGLGRIGEGIRQLARDTGTSHADLTTAYYDLVSAGIAAADAQDVLTAANTLAIGGLSTTAEAVDLLTTAINSYGGDATKAAEYADMFAQAIAAGKVTAAEIAASFAQVGPMAAQMGIGVDEISASLGLMTAQGTPAAEAMTQMRAAMIALQRQTPEMTRVLKALGIENAAQYADVYGLVPLYDKLRRKAEELGIPMIELTGRVEGMNFAFQNTGDNLEDYVAGLDKVRDSSGVAADQMSERQQGLNYQLARMKTLAHDAAITIGDALLPKIVPRIQELVEWLATHQDKVKEFGDDIAAAFDQVVAALGKVPWATVGSALQTAGAGAKMIMEWFLKAPGWLQFAIVSGWGLNKLTGGALGTLVGQLGAGLIKGILNLVAGVVNVRGGVVNTIGGGPGVGGGRGLPPILPGLGVAAAGAAAFAGGAWVGANVLPEVFPEAGRPHRMRSGAWFGDEPGETAGRGMITGPPGGGRTEYWAQSQHQEALRTNRNLEILLFEGRATRQGVERMLPNTAVTAARAQQTIDAVRATHGYLAAVASKNFSPTINVRTDVTNNVSVNEWMRTARSTATSYSARMPEVR